MAQILEKAGKIFTYIVFEDGVFRAHVGLEPYIVSNETDATRGER